MPRNIPDYCKHALLLLLVGVSLLAVWIMPAIPQDTTYHAFADQRTLFCVQNFYNVAGNVLFLPPGIAGLVFSLRHRAGAWRAWAVFFTGVGLVCVGSTYYHLAPSDATLVWDRLPMTLAFMGLWVAILSEQVDAGIETYLLWPALLLGLASVGYWRWSGDLRPYVWVQATPLLTIPAILLLYDAKHTQQWLLLAALAAYALAKLAEFGDHALYLATGQVLSGHALKHILAALACWLVWWRLNSRESFSLPQPGY